MNLNILKNIGLSDSEIKIYNALLEQGELSAGVIINASGLKRGDCYNKIYSLKKKGLVEEFTKNKKKYFRILDPNNIENLIDKKYTEISDTKKMVSTVMPDILSKYNLAFFKPRVNFYEGLDGFKKVLYDTLTAKSIIYTYADIEAIQKYAKEINARYVKKREEMKKLKRVLVADTKYNRDYFLNQAKKATDVKFVDYPLGSFNIGMQIYDNKISYLNMSPKSIMSVLIEDASIAKMHRGLFEYNWGTAKE